MAVLFVASEPVTLEQLAVATDSNPKEAKKALSQLSTSLNSGLTLSVHNDHYQLVTAPEASEAVARFLLQEARSDLTRPALETLAVIAYRGPITKSGIEDVRGVASDIMIKNLVQRGLVTEAGRSTEAGRPVLYTVSHAFLQQFGLRSIEELPPLPDEDGS